MTQGANIRPVPRSAAVERARVRIAGTSLADLEESFQARRDFGPNYGYADPTEWWETQTRLYPELFKGDDPLPVPVFVAAYTPQADPIADYVASYAGSWDLMRSFRRQVEDGKPLTARQREVAANSMARESQWAEERKAKQEAAKQREADSKRVEATITDGMFRDPATETIWKVQKAVHGSGRLYAKRLIPSSEFGGTARFEYEPGAINRINPDWRMSLDEAKAFGALYGTCCVCGRTLTNEESIAAGIGPVCAGKGMWA